MSVDVRVISSSSKNIKEQIELGLLREDLYYRLNVVHIKLPSLKERFEDIPDLSSAFLNSYYIYTLVNRIISYEGMYLLKDHSWAGNIIELKNVIESRCGDLIGLSV